MGKQYKVKIYGAGSVGNHLSHAARHLGWEVHLCDTDPAALERTRRQIYPGRYGNWDDSIQLFKAPEAPRGGYDLIIIGTPPPSHLSLAWGALQEEPAALLIEKPVCPPDLQGAQNFYEMARKSKVNVFVGYNHTVGAAALKVQEMIRDNFLGEVETIDVEFREFWDGIFAAHPWLTGPKDSYLGYWRRGGGAGGEHSHALNLWQHFAHLLGLGKVSEVEASIDYVTEEGLDYDRIYAVNLKTESGVEGRVIQDVVTRPPKKWARIQGRKGTLEWRCSAEGHGDCVVAIDEKGVREEYPFAKSRADDFIRELDHIQSQARGGVSSVSTSLERGLDTVLVVAAGHRSAQRGQPIRIVYDRGYGLEALEGGGREAQS